MNTLAPASQPASPDPASKTQTAPSKKGVSIISSDIEISGNVETSGDVHIHGRIDGDVKAGNLTVGEDGRSLGEGAATQIVVNGAVNGKLVGDLVELRPSAKVEGDIHHKTLEVQRGAAFEGSVKRR